MSSNPLARAIEWIRQEIDARGPSVFIDAARHFGLDEWDLRKRWNKGETYRKMITNRRAP